MVRRFLVYPLLTPWVLVLLVAALNPRPQLSLRLLVWTTPALPIGAWLAMVSSGGAVLGFSASALALQGRRQSSGGFFAGDRFRPGRRGRRATDDFNPGVDQGVTDDRSASVSAATAAAGPRRAPGEPAPTVSVPFRVIRRPTASSGAAASSRRSVSPPTTSTSSGSRAAGDDGWADDGDEDW
ncbi:MAG: hypothetical protein ACKOCM_04360 [Cyanobacteriota bacterium]